MVPGVNNDQSLTEGTLSKLSQNAIFNHNITQPDEPPFHLKIPEEMCNCKSVDAKKLILTVKSKF